MKQFREFVVNALVGGLLVVVPIYLAVLLLLKAMQSLAGFVRPFAMYRDFLFQFVKSLDIRTAWVSPKICFSMFSSSVSRASKTGK